MRSPRTILAVCGLALTLGACGGGGDEKAGEPTATTAEVSAAAQLERGEVAVHSAGADVALDTAAQAAVMDVAQRYVDAAVLSPIVDGELGSDFPALFEDALRERATTADAGALTDQGVPEATGSPKVEATPVRIDALADPAGTIVLLGATFEIDVKAPSAGGEYRVHRANDFTLAPGADGTWLVTGYRVVATRELPDAPATTTTAEAGA